MKESCKIFPLKCCGDEFDQIIMYICVHQIVVSAHQQNKKRFFLDLNVFSLLLNMQIVFSA